ncbi:hypothetical protein MASR2M79_19740 [Aminivibrio sp.]
MQRRFYLCSAAIIFLFLFIFTSGSAFALPKITEEHVPGEVLVLFRPGTQEGSALSAFSSVQPSSTRLFSTLSKAAGQQIGFVKSQTKSTEELIVELSADPRVQLVEPNYIGHLFGVSPNDQYFDRQWGLQNSGAGGGTAGADISAANAWTIRTSAPEKIVAVIDSGVNASHPDLAANMWRDAAGKCGYDFLNDDDDPEDDNGHGTHVAGIIGAVGNNAIGVCGVAWNVKIIALKIGDGIGRVFGDSELKAYEWVLAKKKEGVDIVAVNASYGGFGSSEITKLAIAALGDENIVYVAAAGNFGINIDILPTYPASYNLPNILSVAATDKNDNLASFSNYGTTTVDLAAPGDGIWSTVMGYEHGAGDLFFDDMEAGPGKWVTSADVGSVDSWAISADVSGTEHFWTSGYQADNVSRLTVSEDIDLSGTAAKPLILAANIKATMLDPDNAKNSDKLSFQFSKDGGNSWKEMLSISGNTGNDGVPVYQSISPEYRTDSFRFRFVFSTGTVPVSGKTGVFLDNIGIGESTSTYGEKGGTSMAAPFVTGAVALVAAQFPGQSPIARILENTDPLPSLQGKVATGGRLNLYKALTYREPKGDVEGCSGVGFSPYFLLLALPLAALLKRK